MDHGLHVLWLLRIHLSEPLPGHREVFEAAITGRLFLHLTTTLYPTLVTLLLMLQSLTCLAKFHGLLQQR